MIFVEATGTCAGAYQS